MKVLTEKGFIEREWKRGECFSLIVEGEDL